MSATQPPAPAEAPPASWRRGLWIYGVMVVAALVGIGFTSAGGPQVSGVGPRLVWVWVAILPVYFGVCVWHGWNSAVGRDARFRLVVTQALHWLAFFVAMQIVQTNEVRGVLDNDAEGVTMMMLLAIGTFVAGVHAWSLPICLTGLVLGAATPLIAWIEQTALLLFVVAACAAVVFVPVWLFWRRRTGQAPAG